ncbi:MAG TPA: TonB-dependent receptor [Candidatus Udaeobacter sp.]|nr:TonB-dependent receptor [Candidatus Udaeobacter sp.]
MRSVVRSFLFLVSQLALLTCIATAQMGNSGSIEGVVKDPSGAVVPGAAVQIANPVSGYTRSTTTDANGSFHFTNVPFNPYHLTVTAEKFAGYSQDAEVRSGVPVHVEIALKIGSEATTVNVTENGGDLIENDPTFHTDVDRDLFQKMPLESASSSVSSLVTLTTPGVAADSNGLFHGLGDHASNSFSVDGQPITDQQSKVFSNQIPADSIQSLEVISGAPPAEFGDKTSLVIKVTTRSGLGVNKPVGSVVASYGSFGTSNLSFDMAYGGDKWGNFIAVSGLNSGRFLDPPEQVTFHDKGNQENVFDRVDYQFSQKDTLHLNLAFTRSWFQNPNSFDAQLATGWNGLIVDNSGLGPNGQVVGSQDQRSQIRTFNIAPVWTRLISSNTVLNFGGFVRQDQYNYYPSRNPFADLTPGLQQQSIAQDRRLTNTGVRSDISHVKGIHNIKAGIVYEQTFLTEKDRLGIVDPTFNAVCLNPDGSPFTNPGLTDPAACAGAGLQPNNGTNRLATVPVFNPLLGCYDLTRTATLPASDGCPAGLTTSSTYLFRGHTDVKQLALYVQDTITKGNWAFNLGVRGDKYNGLAGRGEFQPRLGVAYNIKPSSTVLRLSYARTMETPFNENLVLSSVGCNDPVVNGVITSTTGSCLTVPLTPGWRNEFHAGLQQAFGKYLVIDGDYIWKYTHYGFDFSIFGATPIFFPVEWHNSKIPGYAIRASVPNFHGFSALVVMSSVAARFFTPQVSGIGVTPGGGPNSVFRIDHDEKFNQTTHLQYQPWQRGPWVGFNWRYDSGLVAGAVPFGDGINPNVDVSGLTPDQQFQAGLFCGNVFATPTTPISSVQGGVVMPNVCPATQYGSKFLQIPAAGTENDDKNPPRVQARNLFDLAIGHDNLFHGDRYKWSLRFTVINLSNKTAVYNFLSTFSGTHYVTPRSETVELGFHF